MRTHIFKTHLVLFSMVVRSNIHAAAFDIFEVFLQFLSFLWLFFVLHLGDCKGSATAEWTTVLSLSASCVLW